MVKLKVPDVAPGERVLNAAVPGGEDTCGYPWGLGEPITILPSP